MASNVVRKYSLDRTGVNTDNKVINEEHILDINLKYRSVVPKSGPIFKTGLVVRDITPGLVNSILVEGTDYDIGDLFQEATHQLGKEVISILVITKLTTSKVRITYQVVGGIYSHDDVTVRNIYDAILNNPESVYWNNIKGRPDRFDPSLHLHKLSDTVGFEPIVSGLERIRSAIILSNVPAFETLLKLVDDLINKQKQFIIDKSDEIDTSVDNLNTGHAQVIADKIVTIEALIEKLKRELVHRQSNEINVLLPIVQNDFKKLEITLRSVISDVSDDVTTKQTEATGLITDKVTELERDINNLGISLRGDISDLSDEVTDKQTEATTLITNKVDELGRDITALETSLRSDISDLNDSVTTKQTEATDLIAEKVTELERDIQTAIDGIRDGLSGDIKLITDGLAEIRAGIASVNSLANTITANELINRPPSANGKTISLERLETTQGTDDHQFFDVKVSLFHNAHSYSILRSLDPIKEDPETLSRGAILYLLRLDNPVTIKESKKPILSNIAYRLNNFKHCVTRCIILYKSNRPFNKGSNRYQISVASSSRINASKYLDTSTRNYKIKFSHIGVGVGSGTFDFTSSHIDTVINKPLNTETYSSVSASFKQMSELHGWKSFRASLTKERTVTENGVDVKKFIPDLVYGKDTTASREFQVYFHNHMTINNLYDPQVPITAHKLFLTQDKYNIFN